jgi:hypothetical protein
MKLSDVIGRVIEDAMVSARRTYANDEPKRTGALAGLSECRGKTTDELGVLLHGARLAATTTARQGNVRHWEVAAFAAEVQWVCECASAVMKDQGMVPLVQPTPAATLKVMEIVGAVVAVRDKRRMN